MGKLTKKQWDKISLLNIINNAIKLSDLNESEIKAVFNNVLESQKIIKRTKPNSNHSSAYLRGKDAFSRAKIALRNLRERN